MTEEKEEEAEEHKEGFRVAEEAVVNQVGP